MSNIFNAHFKGVYKPDALSHNFIQKFADRVDNGLFPMASPQRNRYKLVSHTEAAVHFYSVGLLTTWNIGLNDVKIERNSETGEIKYEVEYGAWSRIGLGFGGILFLFFLIAQVLYPESCAPKEYQYIFWPFIGFWCFVWPFILSAMHKKPAEKCLIRILDEINDLDN